MELLKLLSANEMVAQIISFMILLAVLRHFLWKPYFKVLDGRKATIAAEIKKAEDVQAETLKLKAFYQEQLEKIDEIGRTKILEAMAEGYKEAERIREEGRKEAQKIVDAGKAYIQSEFTKVEQRVKDRIVDLTMEATRMILEQKASGEDDKRLVTEFIDKLETGRTGFVK